MKMKVYSYNGLYRILSGETISLFNNMCCYWGVSNIFFVTEQKGRLETCDKR